jgi:O-antigen ligase
MTDHVSANRPNRVSSFILCLAIGGAPLPFGSRDPITVAFWCFLLGFGLLFASPRQLRSGHFLLLGGIAFIIACYGFVLHEQLAEHPWIASPNPIWAKTSELLGRPLPPSVSIIRGEPFYALGAQLANVLALVLGLIVGADRDRARRSLQVMVWAGVGYAAYGIANLLFDPTAFLWREKTVNTDSLTATFINRNTAAAYFGSCAVACLIMLMASVRRKLPAGPIVWAKLAPKIVSGDQRQIIIRFVMFFVCLSAMFMTGSRGGVLLSLFAMVVAFIVFLGRDLPRAISLVLAVAGAGAVALVLLQFLGGNVESRINAEGLVEQGRLAAYQSALRIIADYPWFGTGLGTFTSIFPAYRSGNISIFGVWNVAHSTPLELAVELGIPLTLVIAAGWIVAIVVLIRGTRRSRRDTVVPHVAFAVSLIALLHSSIDFSLQVSGYAIVVFALVGVGLAQSIHADSLPRHRRGRSESLTDEIKNSKNGLGERADAIRGDAGLSGGGLSAVAAYLRSWVSPSD